MAADGLWLFPHTLRWSRRWNRPKPAPTSLAAWVKSDAEQTIALLAEDTNQPWVGYTCAEIKVPGNQWVQVETFCSLDRDGSLTSSLGELSKDFRLYHGVSASDGKLHHCR